jgi:DNA-binding MarR family transcriptional regulator
VSTTETAARTGRATPHASLSSDLRMAVTRLSRTLRAQKADASMSDAQFSALAQLQRYGPRSLAALSEAEGVTPPSMTKTVNALIDRGLVGKSEDTEDKRKILLTVTDAGDAVVRETRRRRDAWLAPRLAHLTPTERRTIAEATDIMRRLTQL